MTEIFSQSTLLPSLCRLNYSALQCFVQQKNQEINPDSLRSGRTESLLAGHGWLLASSPGVTNN